MSRFELMSDLEFSQNVYSKLKEKFLACRGRWVLNMEQDVSILLRRWRIDVGKKRRRQSPVREER